MSLLLPSSAPSAWTASVEEAARLLRCSWDSSRGAELNLGTLALLLYSRTHNGRRAPADVPLDELRGALGGPPVEGSEPGIRHEILDALRAAGHAPGNKPHSGPLWQTYVDLANRYTTGDLDGLEPPGPSPMRWAVERLALELEHFTEEARSELDAVPGESGPLRIDATEGIFVATASSIVPLRCSHSCPNQGSTLLVDGPLISSVCPNGHSLRDWRLSAVHARKALRALDLDPATQGHIAVDGPFYIPESGWSEDASLEDTVWARSREHAFVGRDDAMAQLDQIAGQ